jgi:CheY-like chemotaxis protein
MDRVLVLEDEPTLRKSLCRLLRQNEELAISETGSFRDAVRLLDERPNLIVSDLDLPDGSGLDLLQELALRGLSVPVVFVTAYLSRFQAQLPVSTNIDVVEKPFVHEKFARLIRRRLARQSSAPPNSAFSVADYLQLAGMARRDVCLTISGSNGKHGKIIVQDGQTAWAEDQQGEGVDAFRRLAFLSHAQVNCRPSHTRVPAPNIQGSLEQLLLDAARQLDEGTRSSEPVLDISPSSAPVLDTVVESSKPQPPPIPPRPATRERPVSAAQPREPTTSLDKLLSASVRGVARAQRDGSVIESSGELDPGASSAVAAVAMRHVQELAAELGLGNPLSWHASVGQSSWYVLPSHDGLLVAVGGPSRNPVATLNKVEEDSRSVPGSARQPLR